MPTKHILQTARNLIQEFSWMETIEAIYESLYLVALDSLSPQSKSNRFDFRALVKN